MVAVESAFYCESRNKTKWNNLDLLCFIELLHIAPHLHYNYHIIF